jgi:hypothetical protein|tara:strand:- start:820 stop:1032 length:213 start_codon:yes stop_codon:yes gene_type:complete
MREYNNPDIFIVLMGFIGILVLGALLSEVAVWVAKLLGFEFEDEDYINTDFYQRLQDGEELTSKNMFSNE